MARTRTEQREFIPHYIRQQALYECNRICAHCGTPLDYNTNFTLEHVIPLSKGGKNDISNYVALCETCNKAKSDDIVEPNEYYTYLPKEKKAQLQALFEEYLKTTDWLGYDNLFRTDRFDLRTVVPVLNKSGQINVPVTFRVEKARRNITFEYLTVYTGHLSPDDKECMVYDERDIRSPYYKITKGEETVMYISPYIMNMNTDGGEPDNMVYLDIYVNPNLTQKRTTIPTLYNLVQELLNEIQRTLMSREKLTAIKCVVRTIRSDKLGAMTLAELYKLNPSTYSLVESYTNEQHTGSCVMCLCGILFQGDYNDLKQMAKANGFASIDEFCKATDTNEMQSAIDNRLSQAKEITTHKKPTKIKKKDKKKSKKKR